MPVGDSSASVDVVGWLVADDGPRSGYEVSAGADSMSTCNSAVSILAVEDESDSPLWGADASVESAGSEPRSPPASPTIDPFSVGAAELSLGSGVQTPLSAFTLVSRLLLSHAEVATKSSANTLDAPRDVVRLTNGIWRVARASSLCGWRVTRRPLGGNPRAWTLPTRRTTPSERPCQLEVGTSGLRP